MAAHHASMKGGGGAGGRNHHHHQQQHPKKGTGKEIYYCEVCSMDESLSSTVEGGPVSKKAKQQQAEGKGAAVGITTDPSSSQARKEAKYRCPNCYLRYCSVTCFKQHKEIPCQKHERPAPHAALKRSRPPQTTSFELSAILQGGAGANSSFARDLTEQQAIQKEEEALEEQTILTNEMKDALRDSKWLKTALTDSTLCSLLSDIHHHGQNRAKKLREVMQQYPDFQGFVDRLLLEIGALKYEEGRLVFT